MSGVLSLVGLLGPIARYLYPVTRATAAQRQRVATVDQVGLLPAAFDFDYQEVPCTLLQVSPGRFLGLSRICTHLGCVVKWEPKAAEFHCPCHAGIFSPTGQVLSGPPPRPLPRLKLSVEGNDVWADGWQPTD